MPRRPPIALAPDGRPRMLARAIEAGGGEVVTPDRAEALVWSDPRGPGDLPDLLAAHPGIRWIQLPWAGIEPFAHLLDEEHRWTCAKGAYAEEVAEHALALTLAGLRHLGPFARARTWTPPEGRNLLGTRVTVLGGGGITASFLRLLGPFGCTTTVLRRRPDPVPGATSVGTLDDLDRVLPDTDVLVLALALTPETEGVVDGRRLALLPDHAWLVNVARGRHVVTDDLVAALAAGTLGGAALDVTDPEPLPDGHPLWSEPRALITPHTANTPEMAGPVLAARITENVRRWAAGQDLLGRIDPHAGY